MLTDATFLPEACFVADAKADFLALGAFAGVVFYGVASLAGEALVCFWILVAGFLAGAFEPFYAYLALFCPFLDDDSVLAFAAAFLAILLKS